jgi:uncharacterized membrane protein YbaN (DUF454 family)
MKKQIRIIWLAGGYVAIALGSLGVVVPLLPTVPFLLLALFCFSKSSPQLFRRLLENRWLGPPLRDYRESKGIRLHVKIGALTFLGISMTVSICLINIVWVRIMLLCITIAVTIHILWFRTIR